MRLIDCLQVDIALQLTDGSRPIVKCSPELNLYEMLKKFAQTYKDSVGLESVSEPERTPVIQYLSEEVVGRAALETKTLKKLGIIGGRTLLRFLIRPVTSTELRAAVQQAETELAKEKQLDSQFEARIQANLERNKVDSEVNEGPVELGLPRSQPVGIPIPQSNTPETPCNTPVVPSMLNNTGVRLSQLHYTLEALNQNLRGNVPLPDEVVQMNPVLHDSVAQAQLVQVTKKEN